MLGVEPTLKETERQEGRGEGGGKEGRRVGRKEGRKKVSLIKTPGISANRINFGRRPPGSSHL